MALLDVTQVLTCPEFTSTYDLYQDTSTLVDGVIVPSQNAVLGLTGVVQPAGAKSLDLLPDGERRTGSIDIWTTSRVTQGYQGRDADEVVWQGSRYRVMNVQDWTNFGVGFIKATCVLMQVNPVPYVDAGGSNIPAPQPTSNVRIISGTAPGATVASDGIVVVSGPTLLNLESAPPDDTTHVIKLNQGAYLKIVPGTNDFIDGETYLEFTEPNQAMTITYQSSLGWIIY